MKIQNVSVQNSYRAVSALFFSVFIIVMVNTASVYAKSDDVLSTLYVTTSPVQKLAWYKTHAIELVAIKDINERAKAYHLIGQAFYQVGELNKAETMMRDGLKLLENTKKIEQVIFAIYNDLGLIEVSRKDYVQALDLFEAALEHARSVGDASGSVTSALNVVKANIELDKSAEIETLLKQITNDIGALPPTLATANHWLGLGQLYRISVQERMVNSSARLEVLKAYNSALNIANLDKDHELQSFSNGYLGELYEDEKRYEDALTYTRKALFSAQKLADDTVLYRWQWQIARLLKAQGKIKASLESYRQAVATLNRSRTSLTLNVGVNFNRSVGPVFYQYSDLLLKQSSNIKDGKAKQEALKEVIDVLEALKLAEVEDYFDSECVFFAEHKIKLTDINSDSAIIYPVLLEDRVELIVQLPGIIKQYSSLVKSEELSHTINQFRKKIETYDVNHSYLESAKSLYEWLIKPAEAAINESGVSTIVFIPDGPLRSIPASAFHDGEKFLVEKYAVATTPGITLTDPVPFNRENIRVLANGLTESVQGYSTLPSVKQELNNINSVFNTTLFKDSGYLLDDVQSEMSGGSYNVVHFATHGEFNRDHNKSFLLTYDGKLTMDMLEDTIGLRRFQTEPIELLVLSACQTAVGDDRAALGLAGIAIKAGARSALATLWFINDKATSQLIADFYQQLSQPQVSKAQALQTAQVNMLSKTSFNHPSFWAPFLLIGNWM